MLLDAPLDNLQVLSISPKARSNAVQGYPYHRLQGNLMHGSILMYMFVFSVSALSSMTVDAGTE